MTATHLFRGNDKGEILDADGRVVGRIVPVEASESMCKAAVIFANGSAVYKNVAAAALRIEESIYAETYEAILSAAPTDWSGVAVQVPERVACGDYWDVGFNAALDAITGAK